MLGGALSSLRVSSSFTRTPKSLCNSFSWETIKTARVKGKVPAQPQHQLRQDQGLEERSPGPSAGVDVVWEGGEKQTPHVTS